MLEGVFGNITVEKILFTLYVYGEGYPLGMARTFGDSVNRFQQQLKRLEDAGIVASRLIGRVRVYTFNPRYPFLGELKTLIEKAFEFLPEKEKGAYYSKRTRPRRTGKPL
ncbi:MAG: winged helix-turn-helix transcriptional regulator [Nitrospirae bacterium]|nr:winged helix-turn-helix transcriptional regulator [Nitrospirota bacterium]